MNLESCYYCENERIYYLLSNGNRCCPACKNKFNIKLSKHDMQEIMEIRNFDLMSRTGDNSEFHFCNKKLEIHAIVKKDKSNQCGWKIKLEYHYKLIICSTIEFDFLHNRFQDLFLKQILEIKL